MAARTPAQRLKQIPARSGRVILEQGAVFNEANREYAATLSAELEMSLRGRAFAALDFQTIAAGTSTWYTLEVPAGTYLVQYRRTVKVSGGEFLVESLEGGSYTGGTPVTVRNKRQGEPTSNSTILSGTTVTGASLVQTEFLIGGTGANAEGISAEGKSVLVYPPGAVYHLRVTNETGTDYRQTLHYNFAEISQAEFDRIGDINVE